MTDVEELRAASPRPWSYDGPPDNVIIWCGPDNRVAFMTSNGPAAENAALIVTAVNERDHLLAEVERLRKRPLSGEETGWLIEHPTEPKWWTGDPGFVGHPDFWTTDSLKALRFARREDAENQAHWAFDGECRITEHCWS